MKAEDDTPQVVPDVNGKSCEVDSCKEAPKYAFEGEIPRCCRDHAVPGMTDVISQKCKTESNTKDQNDIKDGSIVDPRYGGKIVRINIKKPKKSLGLQVVWQECEDDVNKGWLEICALRKDAPSNIRGKVAVEDRIYRVNGTKVDSTDTFVKALSATASGETISLELERFKKINKKSDQSKDQPRRPTSVDRLLDIALQAQRESGTENTLLALELSCLKKWRSRGLVPEDSAETIYEMIFSEYSIQAAAASEGLGQGNKRHRYAPAFKWRALLHARLLGAADPPLCRLPQIEAARLYGLPGQKPQMLLKAWERDAARGLLGPTLGDARAAAAAAARGPPGEGGRLAVWGVRPAAAAAAAAAAGGPPGGGGGGVCEAEGCEEPSDGRFCPQHRPAAADQSAGDAAEPDGADATAAAAAAGAAAATAGAAVTAAVGGRKGPRQSYSARTKREALVHLRLIQRQRRRLTGPLSEGDGVGGVGGGRRRKGAGAGTGEPLGGGGGGYVFEGGLLGPVLGGDGGAMMEDPYTEVARLYGVAGAKPGMTVRKWEQDASFLAEQPAALDGRAKLPRRSDGGVGAKRGGGVGGAKHGGGGDGAKRGGGGGSSGGSGGGGGGGDRAKRGGGGEGDTWRHARWPRFERRLADRYQRVIQKEGFLSNKDLTSMAKDLQSELCKEHGESNEFISPSFRFSTTWLSKFKQRFEQEHAKLTNDEATTGLGATSKKKKRQGELPSGQLRKRSKNSKVKEPTGNMGEEDEEEDGRGAAGSALGANIDNDEEEAAIAAFLQHRRQSRKWEATDGEEEEEEANRPGSLPAPSPAHPSSGSGGGGGRSRAAAAATSAKRSGAAHAAAALLAAAEGESGSGAAAGEGGFALLASQQQHLGAPASSSSAAAAAAAAAVSLHTEWALPGQPQLQTAAQQDPSAPAGMALQQGHGALASAAMAGAFLHPPGPQPAAAAGGTTSSLLINPLPSAAGGVAAAAAGGQQLQAPPLQQQAALSAHHANPLAAAAAAAAAMLPAPAPAPQQQQQQQQAIFGGPAGAHLRAFYAQQQQQQQHFRLQQQQLQQLHHQQQLQQQLQQQNSGQQFHHGL